MSFNIGFYNVDPDSLPKDAQYYHNVCVTVIAVSAELWNEVEEIADLDGIYYTEGLTAALPTMTVFYLEEELDEDLEFGMEVFPHSVVEIQSDGNICWYDGKGQTYDENPWQF